MDLKNIDNFREWNEENLKLKNYIFFEYLRILSGLSIRELAKKAEKNTSTIRRIQQSLKEHEIVKNLQDLYSIMTNEILKNNKHLYNTLEQFDICENEIIENSAKLGIFFWNFGYKNLFETIDKNKIKKLPVNYKEIFKEEYDRIEKYLKSQIEEYYEYIMAYVKNDDVSFNIIFILAYAIDILVELTDIEWEFIKRFSNIEKDKRKKIKEYINMFYELNIYSLKKCKIEKINKYEKFYLKCKENFDYYEINKNRRNKLLLEQQKRKPILIKEIQDKIESIKNQNNSKLTNNIMNFVFKLDILIQTENKNELENGDKDIKKINFELWDTFKYFFKMINSAKNENNACMQGELIIELMK